MNSDQRRAVPSSRAGIFRNAFPVPAAGVFRVVFRDAEDEAPGCPRKRTGFAPLPCLTTLPPRCELRVVKHGSGNSERSGGNRGRDPSVRAIVRGGSSHLLVLGNLVDGLGRRYRNGGAYLTEQVA